MENLNSRVIDVEYAVRGPIVLRAAEIERQLRQVDPTMYEIHRLLLSLVSRARTATRSTVLFERTSATVTPVATRYR